MPSDPRKDRRRSVRLEGYDCARPGAYFVTICAQGGEPLFDQVEAGRMHLNPAGKMVWRWWRKLNDKYPYRPIPSDGRWTERIQNVMDSTNGNPGSMVLLAAKRGD